jgi:hypothetical protein
MRYNVVPYVYYSLKTSYTRQKVGTNTQMKYRYRLQVAFQALATAS